MIVLRTLRTTSAPCPLGTPQQTAALFKAMDIKAGDTAAAKQLASDIATADGLPVSPCSNCKGCHAVAALEAQYALLQ